MRLNPDEFVDSCLLLYPQLYDRREVGFLKRELKGGDVFIDVGANIGFYSLLASPLVGSDGQVVAIEADPEMFQILNENIELNDYKNVEPLNLGVSDRCETLRLGINRNGNRGSSSFLADDQPQGVYVPCVPLSQIVRERHIERIAAAKVDIEGFGVRALRSFFQDVPEVVYPRFMIIEDESELSTVMLSAGYEELGFWGFNRVYRRK
jgi:FkbM family methyltransferase